METGTDINELFASTVNTNINIEYNNKIWEFIVRDLTWAEKNNIITKAATLKRAKGGDGNAIFDVNIYNQLFLEKSVIKSPFEMTKMNILKLNSEFGDLLVSKIVNRSEEIDNEELGN